MLFVPSPSNLCKSRGFCWRRCEKKKETLRPANKSEASPRVAAESPSPLLPPLSLSRLVFLNLLRLASPLLSSPLYASCVTIAAHVHGARCTRQLEENQTSRSILPSRMHSRYRASQFLETSIKHFYCRAFGQARVTDKPVKFELVLLLPRFFPVPSSCRVPSVRFCRQIGFLVRCQIVPVRFSRTVQSQPYCAKSHRMAISREMEFAESCDGRAVVRCTKPTRRQKR